MQKLTKISAIVLISILGIGLAGCGQQSTHHSSHIHTSKVTHNSIHHSARKSHKKSHKKSVNKTHKHNLSSSASTSKSSAKPVSINHNKASHNSGSGNVATSSNTGMPQLNLGNGIHATEDHGAGQTYISFVASGHHVIVHGNNFGNGNTVAENKARSIAQNINKLPKSQTNVNVNA